ncbi:hypothetical protein J7L02_03630 [Candidatus Woesearchaeota archaeon]|nr:hypothetical protein [Candidatus Woesearchaeota archaeon]
MVVNLTARVKTFKPVSIDNQELLETIEEASVESIVQQYKRLQDKKKLLTNFTKAIELYALNKNVLPVSTIIPEQYFERDACNDLETRVFTILEAKPKAEVSYKEVFNNVKTLLENIVFKGLKPASKGESFKHHGEVFLSVDWLYNTVNDYLQEGKQKALETVREGSIVKVDPNPSIILRSCVKELLVPCIPEKLESPMIELNNNYTAPLYVLSRAGLYYLKTDEELVKRKLLELATSATGFELKDLQIMKDMDLVKVLVLEKESKPYKALIDYLTHEKTGLLTRIITSQGEELERLKSELDIIEGRTVLKIRNGKAFISSGYVLNVLNEKERDLTHPYEIVRLKVEALKH